MSRHKWCSWCLYTSKKLLATNTHKVAFSHATVNIPKATLAHFITCFSCLTRGINHNVTSLFLKSNSEIMSQVTQCTALYMPDKTVRSGSKINMTQLPHLNLCCAYATAVYLVLILFGRKVMSCFQRQHIWSIYKQSIPWSIWYFPCKFWGSASWLCYDVARILNELI